MNVFTKEYVKAAFETAMKLDESQPRSTAIKATAQALCLPVETVKEVVEAKEGQPA